MPIPYHYQHTEFHLSTIIRFGDINKKREKTKDDGWHRDGLKVIPVLLPTTKVQSLYDIRELWIIYLKNKAVVAQTLAIFRLRAHEASQLHHTKVLANFTEGQNCVRTLMNKSGKNRN